MADSAALDRVNTPTCSVNRSLLQLKSTYFLFFSFWTLQYSYLILISTQIISFKQLAVINVCVPGFAIFGPFIAGFVADKTGSYRWILILLTCLSGVVYLPVLWLQSQHKNDASDPSIFPVLLVIQVIGFVLFDASISLLDSCGLSMAKKHGGDFGRQRLWGIASTMVVPVSAGLLIDAISEYRGFKDYSIAFYISSGISLAVLPLMYQLDVQVQKNEHSLTETAKKVMCMLDVDVFLLVEMVVGLCMGWHRSFFLVYTDKELEASKTLFGAAMAIGGLSTVTMYWTSKYIVDRLGAPTTVATSLTIYSLKCFIYYFLRNRWIILAVELLEGLTVFLGFVAGNYFCAAAAPPGMAASMNGLLTAASMGAGRQLGLTLGSVLISAYGIRFTYLVMAILSGVTAVLYMIAYHSFFKKMELARLSKEDVKEGVDNPSINAPADQSIMESTNL